MPCILCYLRGRNKMIWGEPMCLEVREEEQIRWMMLDEVSRHRDISSPTSQVLRTHLREGRLIWMELIKTQWMPSIIVVSINLYHWFELIQDNINKGWRNTIKLKIYLRTKENWGQLVRETQEDWASQINHLRS